ncbi:MAG: penicillin-binding protein activator LpoB [Candidatus Omnitrophica bacterium]|nr:penicillin-binding protein activator LpoB [Candidatus Omnitrophota bacterium]
MCKRMLAVYFVLILGAFSMSGCASTKVERVDVDEQIDLSGDWNDYDAMLVSQEMIKDCLSRPWIHDFVKKEGSDPVVIVGNIRNRTNEHINSQVFVKYLERELLNSGKVTFVASAIERGGIRDEREDQAKGFTDPDTMAEIGKEHGADYMLIGTVNSVIDQVKRKSVNYYQVNLELVDMSTNKKVWIGQKEIKKYVQKPRMSL